MSLTIKDNLPSFTKSLFNVFDDAMREVGRDVLINAKTKAPFDTGQLRADSEVRRISNLHYRVSFWKEYARFQEFGGTTDKKVRNYKTSGTGSGFLKNAGDAGVDKLVSTLRKHAQRARA